MTIAAYVRVSTQKQKDEGSHENQREQIERWADRNDYDEIDWFEDIAISGQSDQRDEYNRLMDSYEQYDALVVRELSRFGRDPLTVLNDIEEITDSNTEFISIKEDFNTDSAMGKAFIRIVAVINGMYADLRREQATRAAERRKEQGLPVGRPTKLDATEIDDVLEWRELGHSYKTITALVEQVHDTEISRETIRRYCKQEESSADD